MASSDGEYTLQERQENELQVLESIFLSDIKDLRIDDAWKVPRPPEMQITLLPLHSTTPSHHEVHVRVDMHVRCGQNYPNEIPDITLKNAKGLSNQALLKLKGELDALAEKLRGEVMILDLCQHVQAFLHEHNKPGFKSFYDEMLCNQRRLEEEQAKAQKRQKEEAMKREQKQLLYIQEEIQKKQEALREEVRKFKKQSNSPEHCIKENGVVQDRFEDGSGEQVPNAAKGGRRRQSTPRCSDDCCDHGGVMTVTFFTNKSKRTVHRGCCLGHSPRGSVTFSAMDVATGEMVALIEWVLKWRHLSRKPSAEELDQFQKEASNYMKQITSMEPEFGVLSRLQHENLVPYLGMKYSLEKDRIVVQLLQKYVRGCTLAHYLYQNIPLELSLLRWYALGVVKALAYLHDNCVVHKDLRDTSIFITSTGIVQVVDYSIDKRLRDLFKSMQKTEAECSDDYPPSLGRGGKKADIYRLGLLLLSLHKGEMETQMVPNIPRGLPAEFNDFLNKCLMHDEHQRWSPDQLLNHPFLKTSIHRGLNYAVRPNKKESDKEEEEEEEQAVSLPPIFTSQVTGHSRLMSEFEILQFLGSGGFGDVLKVKNKLDGRLYAIKRIRLNPQSKLNRKIMREVKLLSRLNHENVVRYYNSWIEVTTEIIRKDLKDSASETLSNTSNNMNTSTSDAAKTKPSFQSLSTGSQIEEFAPPKVEGSIEWSVSYECSAKPQDEDTSSDDDDDDDDDDEAGENVFRTSFLHRLDVVDEDDEEVVFEKDAQTSSSVNNEDNKEASLPSDHEQNKSQRSFHFIYIQMEFCEKSTLRTAIDRGLYKEIDKVWRFFREIVEGLAHIHQQGMIHRDLKPVNIFIDSMDRVKIGDFGLATTDIMQRNAISEPGVGPENRAPLEVDTSLKSELALGDSSLTGRVGTALYVAPELAIHSKVTYNQKVDIYSLGIIFFEMCYPTPGTNMERVKLLLNIRQPDIILPKDANDHLTPQQIYIIKWLLQHDLTKRPTSLELLSSDYLPPPQMEEAEVNEMLRHTVSNPQSKAYKHMVNALFRQETTPAADVTYDMDLRKGPLLHGNSMRLFHIVANTLEKIMLTHGAIKLSTPTLMPKSSVYENNEWCVHLMDHGGSIVALPHDLRVPFARYVARREVTNLKRYALEKVYRQRKVYGSHPRELYECAFDIISHSSASFLPDAEILAVVSDVINEFPALQSHNFQIWLNHTSLLKAILLYAGIAEDKHADVYRFMSDTKNMSHRSFVNEGDLLTRLAISDQSLNTLYQFLEVKDLNNIQKVNTLLKPVIKKKGQPATFAKEAIRELDAVMKNAALLGVKVPIIISPGMVYNVHFFSGMFCQFVCELKKRRRKSGLEVLAAGGRYDKLVAQFSLKPSLSEQEQKQCAVGVSIAVDKIINALSEDEEFQDPGNVDVVICSLGQNDMIREKCAIVKDLWANGVRAQLIYDNTQSLEELTVFCKENRISHLVALKDGDSAARLRVFDKDRFMEKKIVMCEIADYFSKLTLNKIEGSESSQSGSGRSELVRSSSETFGSSGGGGGGSASSSMPKITFFLQEKMALHTKRRCEMQISAQLNPVLQCFSKSIGLEVIVVELNMSVLKTIASHLDTAEDEEAFQASIGPIIEKHPRHRKYLVQIMDHIHELKYEKRCPVIILFDMHENGYKVLL